MTYFFKQGAHCFSKSQKTFNLIPGKGAFWGFSKKTKKHLTLGKGKI